MALATGYLDLLAYKLSYIGLRNTLRVGYLDLSDSWLSWVSRRFPSKSLSPRSIQIECTTRCNLKCTFCELSYWTEKPTDLKLENVQRMVEHLPKLQRIDLTGIGEALMNREFFEIVTYLKGRGLYVTMNDNFTMMTERSARRIVELGVDQIYLSLDGATKATYEQLRHGANFDKVIANTRRLVQVKREMGKRTPELKINSVVCLTNYQELPGIVELAADIGIGMVQFVNIITFEDTTGLDTESVHDDVQRVFKATLERARQLGVRVKIELFDKLPVEQCTFPWTRNFVTHDGHVHPCCYTTQTGDRTAQNRQSFGNLRERPFQEIWDGEVYTDFRSKMLNGILPRACQHCPKYTGKPDTSARRDLVVLGRGSSKAPERSFGSPEHDHPDQALSRQSSLSR
jgi:MoaA/NifB/PqqE/SkfB family radical SAM enzyme